MRDDLMILNFSSPLFDDNRFISRGIDKFSKHFHQLSNEVFRSVYNEDLIFVKDESFELKITNLTNINNNTIKNVSEMKFKDKFYDLTIIDIVRSFSTDKLNSKEFLYSLKDHVFIENRTNIISSIYSKNEDQKAYFAKNSQKISKEVRRKIKRPFEIFISPRVFINSKVNNFLEVIGSFHMIDPKNKKLIHVLSTKIYYLEEVF